MARGIQVGDTAPDFTLPSQSGEEVRLHDRIGERVVVAGAGGLHRSVAARIVAKQEFAGYWEYVLDEAIFTSPAHPNWGGTALIGPAGDLLGIGSLQLQNAVEKGKAQNINMMVPIDLLLPIFDDLMKFGRRNAPPRPWLVSPPTPPWGSSACSISRPRLICLITPTTLA